MLPRSTTQAISQQVAVVGVGFTAQGSQPGIGPYGLAAAAFKDALDDAELSKDAIDGIVGWGGYGGTQAEQFAKIVGLEPRVAAGMDYGSGGYSLQLGAMLVASGVCETVACVYGHNRSVRVDEYSGDVVYDDAQGLVNPAAAAAAGWAEHVERHGPYTEEALGHVVLGARNHALRNPAAVFRAPLTMEQYLDEPIVVEPFRPLDICRVTGGGGYCFILTRADLARERPHPVVLLQAIGRQVAPDPLSNPDHLLLPGMRSVADQVYGAAGCGPEDIDVLGVSDGHSAVVLMTLEQYGFCEFGGSEEFAAGGGIELGGRLPVNPDGGQLSYAYSVGYLHQIELVNQLRGICGERQVEGAGIAQYATTGNFRQEFLSNIYVREDR